MSDFPPEWRRQIREELIACGARPAEADQIVDVSIHAVDEAFTAVVRVADSAGPDIRTNVIPLALQLMAHRASMAAEAAADTIKQNGSHFRTADIVLEAPQPAEG